jgi:hypothetical protein
MYTRRTHQKLDFSRGPSRYLANEYAPAPACFGLLDPEGEYLFIHEAMPHATASSSSHQQHYTPLPLLMATTLKVNVGVRNQAEMLLSIN